MTRVGGFVNTQKLVIDWLTAQMPSRRVASKLPQTFTSFVWVAGVGGPDDYNLTTYRFDVQCFAATLGDVWALAGETHEAIRALSGSQVGGQLVDLARTIDRPTWQFWSTDVERTVATYEIELRPPH